METIHKNKYPYPVRVTSGEVTRAMMTLDPDTFGLSDCHPTNKPSVGSVGYCVAICTSNGRLLVEWRENGEYSGNLYTWVDPQQIVQV